MKQVREGNDISVIWSIMSNDAPVNLSSYELSLYLTSKFEKKKLKDFKTNGNKISWTFFGKDQTARGKYSLTLVLNEGKENMHTVDACDFIELVSCTCKVVNGVDKEGFETEVVELSSTMEFSKGEVEVDTDLSETSENPVQNKAVTAALGKKQDNLVSGENIKTINGESILGKGNLTIKGGSGLQYAVERTVYPTRLESEWYEPTDVEITEEERAYNIETYDMAWKRMEPVFVSYNGSLVNVIGMNDDMAVCNAVSHVSNTFGYNGLYSLTITITKEGDATVSVKQIQGGGSATPSDMNSDFNNDF